MNFLVDVNLPPRLCEWFKGRGHAATHLAEVQSLRTPDREIWKFAGERGETIVSKDMDFYERALIHGKPPPVLLIALGNCSNDELLTLLDSSWKTIESELTTGARLVVFRRNRIEIFA